MFLNTLCTGERVNGLLKHIPSNVLPGRYLKLITKRYSEDFGLIDSDIHPFCELLNAGVMGVVKRDVMTHKKHQHFRKPQDFDWKMQDILSEENLYIFHPSIHDSILDNRGDNYYINPNNIIGDGLPWDDTKRIFPQLFISHASADKDIVEPIVDILSEKLSKRVPCGVWYDNHRIPFGANIYEEIQRGVQESDIVLVFLSHKSLHSGWVTQEWRYKYEQEITDGKVKVICCMLDETPREKIPEFLWMKRMVYMPSEVEIMGESLTCLVQDIEQHLHYFWFPE
jgi:hypothetical protein